MKMAAADEFLRPEIQRSLAEIGDRFTDLEHFASGGLGNVYVGFDKAVSRRVAVKLLKPELISDPRAKSRFLNEGAITGMLEHPGIVPIYDSGVTDDGQPYYAMRLLGGETLKEAVSRLHGKGTDDFEDRQRSLLRRLAQVCDANSFAHNCDIIHRDPSEGAKSSGDSMVEKTKNFCKEFIDPDQIDQQAKIPDAVIKGLAKIGVLGMTINKDHGGAGMTQYNYCRVMEIIGAHCASTAVFVNAHHSIGMRALELFGTDEQKERWLKPLTTGDKIAGFALTEAAAGSDASNVRTEAKLNDNGDYILNGEKRWITNGGIGDVLTVMARTPDPSEPDGKITAFLVTPNMKGFEVLEERMEKVGIRGTATGRIKFTDMVVPKENVLGEVGKGLKLALTVLDFGSRSRIHVYESTKMATDCWSEGSIDEKRREKRSGLAHSILFRFHRT